MRRLGRRLPVATVLAAGAVVVLAAASLAAEPTIEAVSSPSLAWSPSSASIGAGGSATFKNMSTEIRHGVTWTSVPATPSCSGVPINEGQFNWSGKCTFTQAGTYSFVCSVHSFMTGSVTVSGPGPPTVSTGEGAPGSDTEATLHGTVNPNSLSTSYFFEYGKTGPPYEHIAPEPAKSAGEGNAALTESEAVTGLSPGTVYHFRLVAENSASGGPVDGADHTFTTPGPPLVATGMATGIGATDATLQGSVDPDGHETHYFFKYGTTTAYGQKTSLQLAGSDHSQHAVSTALTGLFPETTYHFQLVAENSSSAGPVAGADRTFTTSSPPPPPPPPPPMETTPPPPLEEAQPLGSAVTVVAARHHASVRVSIQVLASGTGGSFQVSLLEKGAKHAIAGRAVRREVPSGTVSVFVPLNARAKRALRRRRRLALEVKIVFTPPAGASVVLTRSVVARA